MTNNVNAPIAPIAPIAPKARKARKAPAAPVLSFVIVDGVKIDLADIHTATLDTILADMVEAEHKGYGAHIRIAAKFNDLMACAWFDIDNGEVSDNATALKPHKDALYKAFKAARHSNPSVPYKRIRDYGRNLRAGLAPNGATMADGSPIPNSVEEGATGEGANPSKRSPMLRNVEELTALWKFNTKQSDLPAKVKAAQGHIEAALKALGVDVRTIKTA
jgi:hypothetical protein